MAIKRQQAAQLTAIQLIKVNVGFSLFCHLFVLVFITIIVTFSDLLN